MIKHLPLFAVTTFIAALCTAAARAQPTETAVAAWPTDTAGAKLALPATAPGSHPRFDLDLLAENDGLRPIAPTDRHYTAGTKVVIAFWPDWADDLANVFPLHEQFESGAAGPATAAGVVVGQDIYTPDNISHPDLQNDQPYAGWLYAGAFWQRSSALRMDHVEIDIGTTGESSQARKAQTSLHQAIGGHTPVGWDQQLPDEVGFNVILNRKWDVLPLDFGGGWGSDVIPSAALTVGTVNRQATLGGIARIGWNLPHDFGPGRIHNTPCYTAPRDGRFAYFFLGGDGSYVEHNLFLDGTTWRDSHSVGALPFTAEAWGGLAFQVNRHIQVSYSLTYLTRQFRGQHTTDGYGTLSLGFQFEW